MVKTKCELCDGVARMFCESDQASLCWDCDGKIHGANFLVAKHTRCLLCSACQSPTLWKASGLRLCPTVSICQSCLAGKKNSGAGAEINSNEDRLREDDGAESYDDDEEDEESDDEEEEEAENQVVPWNAAAAQQSPVLSSSSSVSSGEKCFSGDGGMVVKRTLHDSDHNSSDSDDESNDSPPLKRLTRDETSPRSTAMMKSTLKIQRREKIKRL